MNDLLGMMKQAKELQEKMQSLQAEIAALEATGSSGAGLVTVTVDGKGGLKPARSTRRSPSPRRSRSWRT